MWDFWLLFCFVFVCCFLCLLCFVGFLFEFFCICSCIVFFSTVINYAQNWFGDQSHSVQN